MKTWRVISELHLDGRKYPVGAEVALDDDMAAAALEAGVVSDPAAPAEPEHPSTPTVGAALDTALEALRRATPDEVRTFAQAMAADADIAGALADEPSRAYVIERACRALHLGRDTASWTKAGPPTTGAVREVAGLDVSGAERDAAWAAVEQEAAAS